jgi:hypothetical protein
MAFAQKPATPSTEGSSVPMPADRADDSYAIYSLLIPVLQDESDCACEQTGCRAKQTKKTRKNGYLVLDTTEDPSRGAFLQTPIAQTKPPMTLKQTFFGHLDPLDVPDEQMTRFQEAVADYASRKGERVRLERKLNLPLPYRLMDSKQYDEFRYTKTLPPLTDNTWPSDRRLVEKYEAWGPLSWMSEVYYDQARTLGLVWASRSGGRTNWYAFEKRDGQWRPAAWKDRGQVVQS